MPSLVLVPQDRQDEVGQLCHSLQIVSRRDLDGTVTTVIRAMLTSACDEPVGSSELASKLRINRVTVIHHLQRLERAGIVQKRERKYMLAPQGFGEFVKKMHEETEQMFEQAQMLAQKIDEEYFPAISSGEKNDTFQRLDSQPPNKSKKRISKVGENKRKR